MSNSNRHSCMRNEQWIFYKNVSVFGQTENLWLDEIASKTLTSILGNWAGRNFITASRENSQLMTHARMQRWIWNLQQIQLLNNLAFWRVRLTWLDCNPSSSQSDQYQISLCNINALENRVVMRIKDMIKHNEFNELLLKW